YHEWEIAAYPASERPDGSPAREYLVPHREFVGLDSDESRLFRGENVPFEFTITRVIPNARPVPAGRGPAGNGVADGVFLSERPSEKNSEQNILGADILLKVDGEAAAKPAILLGDGRRLPLLVSTPKGRWAIELRKKRMNLPFGLRLDKFTHEYYPGTMKPRVYMSDVTKLTEDAERKVKIEMNQPLRSDGFTVYQSSWNEDETGLYSGFSVVTNPSDQWPLYACIVIGIGLLVHFGRMLFHYLARETGARS
ncbi:MAG: cytochrome c biogenesis protein ResB, partial [Planctomycetota bacterium]